MNKLLEEFNICTRDFGLKRLFSTFQLLERDSELSTVITAGL